MLVAALALSLLVATSVTACTSSKDTGGEGGSGAGASKSSTPRATNDPAKNGANEMGVDKPDPSKVLFSKQFDIPGNSARKVTVGILSLQRKGRIAILKVVVTPQFADLPATETIDFTKALGAHPLGPEESPEVPGPLRRREVAALPGRRSPERSADLRVGRLRRTTGVCHQPGPDHHRMDSAVHERADPMSR